MLTDSMLGTRVQSAARVSPVTTRLGIGLQCTLLFYSQLCIRKTVEE